MRFVNYVFQLSVEVIKVTTQDKTGIINRGDQGKNSPINTTNALHLKAERG